MNTGLWVFVCGPSGAGKDSVINSARALAEHEPRVVFSRRIVTRTAAQGSEHDETSRAEFRHRRDTGDLAWHWEAHGHGYAIARDYARHVDLGRIVVVNGSREHAATVAHLPSVRTVLVTAPAPVVQDRLRSRAREDSAAIERRMARNEALTDLPADLRIDNTGALEQSGARLAHWLLALAHRRS